MERLRVDNARLKAQQEYASSLKTTALIATFDQKPMPYPEDVDKLQKLLIKANDRVYELESELQDWKDHSERTEEHQTQTEELMVQNSKQEAMIEQLNGALSILREEFQEHRKKA